MRKEQLVKYIEGALTRDQELEVEKWLQVDNRNMSYYAWLKALYVSQGVAMESRAESAEELKLLRDIVQPEPKKHRFVWKKIGIAASVAAVFLLGVLNVWHLVSEYKQSHKRVELSMLAEGYKHTVFTEKGVKARVVLPDSTKVLLNCDSKIIFPDKFSGPTREVYIDGEAYFEVTSDSLCPMVVTTPKDFRVEVKGTTFCINAYRDNAEARATLVNGCVDLINDEGNGLESSTIMNPDDSYIILSDNRVILDPDADAATRAVAWVDGVLIFDSTPMKEVISRLKRWYGVEFIIEDSSVLNWRLTATFHSESINRIMDMLEYTTLIEYSIDKNKITLRKKRI